VPLFFKNTLIWWGFLKIVRKLGQGNKFLRWALTESTLVAIRYSSYFRHHYNKVRARKNPNSAAIAVARRILEIIFVMLKEGRAYIENL
jgi:hypothetical protein